MKKILSFYAAILLFSGCAGIQSTTETYDATGKKLTRTKVMCATLFDANSSLTKLRVTPGQLGNGSNVWSYPGGTSVGTLDQQSQTTTNFNELIGTIVGSAVSAAKKP